MRAPEGCESQNKEENCGWIRLAARRDEGRRPYSRIRDAYIENTGAAAAAASLYVKRARGRERESGGQFSIRPHAYAWRGALVNGFFMRPDQNRSSGVYTRGGSEARRIENNKGEGKIAKMRRRPCLADVRIKVLYSGFLRAGGLVWLEYRRFRIAGSNFHWRI